MSFLKTYIHVERSPNWLTCNMGIIAYFLKNYELKAPCVNLEVYYVQTFKTIGLHFYDGNKFSINHNNHQSQVLQLHFVIVSS